MPQHIDGLELEQERDFDEWVRGRLADWTASEIRELDHWLLSESQFEFVASVRRAWMRRSLDELDGPGSEGPAA